MSTGTVSFWDFSGELYAHDGVSAACLELQNDFGLDINLILFCYWHGSAYGSIDAALLDRVIKFSSLWKQNAVQPLRSVRKWMKLNAALFASEQAEHYEILRQEIKQQELAVEKYQQEAMQGLVRSSRLLDTSGRDSGQLPAPGDSAKAARLNVTKLLSLLSTTMEINEAIESTLSVINSAFDNTLKR